MLSTLAGFVAGADADRKGPDDLTAGVLFAVAAGVDAYAEQDNNQHGNIVDGVIACLTEYRRQAVDLGLITGDRIPEQPQQKAASKTRHFYERRVTGIQLA